MQVPPAEAGPARSGQQEGGGRAKWGPAQEPPFGVDPLTRMLTCRAASPEEADAPRRADAGPEGRRWPGGVGSVRVRHVVALSPAPRPAGPVGAVRDGLGVAPPRPGAPTRTAAEGTVSNDTSTLSCGFSPLHLEHSSP